MQGCFLSKVYHVHFGTTLANGGASPTNALAPFPFPVGPPHPKLLFYEVSLQMKDSLKREFKLPKQMQAHDAKCRSIDGTQGHIGVGLLLNNKRLSLSPLTIESNVPQVDREEK